MNARLQRSKIKRIRVENVIEMEPAERRVVRRNGAGKAKSAQTNAG
jgi:hypothetical protein